MKLKNDGGFGPNPESHRTTGARVEPGPGPGRCAGSPAAPAETPLGGYAPERAKAPVARDLGRSAMSVRARAGRGRRSPAQGPLDLTSVAGRAALTKVRAALPRSPTAIAGDTSCYEPVRAFVDQLGVTHIRLQRLMGDKPIFGEQVNAQIRPGGRVSFAGTPPQALAPEAPVSPPPCRPSDELVDRAKALIARAYGAGPSMAVESATEVLWRHTGPDGTSELRPAHHVCVSDFSLLAEDASTIGPRDHSHATPILAHVLIDAQSGEVLTHWNQLHRPHRADHAPQALRLEEGIDLAAPFGRDRVQVEVPFDRDLTVEKATLRLGTPADPGISHAWRGDVVLEVTAPDGTSARIAPHGPNDRADDVSGDLDLSAAFRGTRALGTWTVVVSDRFPAADDGVVRRIDLALEGPGVGAPPTPPPGGAGDDFAPFVGRVDLKTTETPDGFVLRTADGAVETRDAGGQAPNRVAGRFDRGEPFTDPDDQWGGPEASTRELAAIETHHAATTFLPFLREVFGLESLDDRGMKLEALSNVGIRYNNAFWFRDVFHIGHGDGRIFDRLSTIDIVGHELAHGITEKSANLIYDDQSGGLNESFSDIVGALFEWWHAKQPGAEEAGVLPFDWKIGEDTFTPQGPDDDALRSMKDPLTDGVSIDHFSAYDDRVDVHFSSGIQNNAFYLAVEGGAHRLGGRVDEGGLTKVLGGFDAAMLAAGRIWMRALQFYLTPASGFADARAATRLAARDLFPEQPEVARVIDQAWRAVGVPEPRR